MRLLEAPQPPHKACNDDRSNEEGKECGEILRTLHPEIEKRQLEKEVEAAHGDDGENERRYEVHQGQQYDDKQIDAGGRRGTQTETETRPCRERRVAAPKTNGADKDRN